MQQQSLNRKFAKCPSQSILSSIATFHVEGTPSRARHRISNHYSNTTEVRNISLDKNAGRFIMAADVWGEAAE